MDLIDKIKDILTKIGLKHPIIDIHFDSQNNVIGYICDETFKEKTDEESQKMIWSALKKRLDPEELLKVFVIFHETPSQRSERLLGYKSKDTKPSNLWVYESRDLAKYWLFIDVGKFGDTYKSFFLIINHKDKFNHGLQFTYPKDVIEFMDLAPEEIYNELYNNTYTSAEAEIKIHLMDKYEGLTKKGLWGNTNMFNSVFTSFEMNVTSKNQLLFSPDEIKDIKKGISKVKGKFEIIKEINIAIEKSELLNKLKKTLI